MTLQAAIHEDREYQYFLESQKPVHEQLAPFDFSTTTLSKPSQAQLQAIYDAVRAGGKAATKRFRLRNLLLENCFDPIRGTYVPTAPHVYLDGKLPEFSDPLSETPTDPAALRLEYFTNPMTIPALWGEPTFVAKEAPAPKTRLTNIGFVVVTIEHDCETPEQFETLMAYTRGKNGKFSKSPFAAVDRKLREIEEYLGYSIVFTGNRSLQFHFVFSTRHLVNAPMNIGAAERLNGFHQHSLVMSDAYRLYWNHVDAVFNDILKPPLPSDKRLEQSTQWRRMPWPIRTLKKDSTILGLPAGTQIPQLVIHENIRVRASKGKTTRLIDAMHFPEELVHPRPRSSSRPISTDTDLTQVLEPIRELCEAEWGPYPRPASVRQDGKDWIINFFNDADDKNPSSVARGDYRAVLIQGRSEANATQFFLPDSLTANELVEQIIREQSDELGTDDPLGSPPPIYPDRPPPFPIKPSSPPTGSLAKIKDEYRGKQASLLAQSRAHKHVLNLSVEGIGKTRTVLRYLKHEVEDDAYSHEDSFRRFGAVSYRSLAQARAKVQEYNGDAEFTKAGCRFFVWRSFWDYYREACEACGDKPIKKSHFEDGSPGGIMSEIRSRQPDVFEHLEEIRRQLWATVPFNPHTTILITTHRTVQTWNAGTLTRAWHHPLFKPDITIEEARILATQIVLARVVVDDPEFTDFFHILDERKANLLRETRKQHGDWRNKSRADRINVYLGLLKGSSLPDDLYDFESFDELMRIDPTSLEESTVDFNRAPFGYDSGDDGIYRKTHGRKYFFAPKEWPFANRYLTVLTTEPLVSETWAAITRSRPGRRPFRVHLTHMPGIFPLHIPAIIDDRANHENIVPLAREITAGDSHGIVIANKAAGVDRTLTFQRMKGLNGLEENNNYVIPTALHPDQYAQLNAIGGWLGIDNIIARFYEDQLNQAFGRNSGYRQSTTKETHTSLICSRRLWNNFLSTLSKATSRFWLYRSESRPWVKKQQ